MAKLCKSRKVVNSKVNPKVWYYGLEHCRDYGFAAVPAGETYIPINLIAEDYTEFFGYIWFTNGGANPAPVGRTLIATVDCDGLADVAALLAELETQLLASAHVDKFQVYNDPTDEVVEVINNFIGLITEEPANTAGATVEIGQQSFGGALGLLTEDGASASFEFEKLDQTGDATGNAIVESFLINVLVTIAMSLTDTTKAKFKEMFIKPLGGTYENGPDELIGFGTGNFFKSLISKAGKLIGHDAGVAYSDRSDDWQMLAIPNPTAINFNKELQALETEFVSAYDSTMPEAINIFSIGDKTIVDLAAL